MSQEVLVHDHMGLLSYQESGKEKVSHNRTACKAALASTDKPGVVLKTVNAIKNHWQRV
jgi:hypothetical protein